MCLTNSSWKRLLPAPGLGRALTAWQALSSGRLWERFSHPATHKLAMQRRQAQHWLLPVQWHSWRRCWACWAGGAPGRQLRARRLLLSSTASSGRWRQRLLLLLQSRQRIRLAHWPSRRRQRAAMRRPCFCRRCRCLLGSRPRQQSSQPWGRPPFSYRLRCSQQQRHSRRHSWGHLVWRPHCCRCWGQPPPQRWSRTALPRLPCRHLTWGQ